MQKKIALSLLLVFVFSLFAYVPSAVAAGKTLTINKAVELALLHSPEVQKAQNNWELAYRTEIVKKQEKESAYAWFETSQFTALPLEADYRAKKKMWEAAQDNLSDTKVTLEQIEKKVEYQTESLYLTILKLENQLKLIGDTVKLQTRLVQIERVKAALGLSTKLQVQQAQGTAEATQNVCQELKDTLTTCYRNLNRFIGEEAQAPLQLCAVGFSPVKYNVQKEEGLEQAKEASLALEQFNRMLEDTKKEKRDLAPGSSDQSLLYEAQMRQLELNIEDLHFGIETGLQRAWEKIELTQKKLIEAKNKYEKVRLQQAYQQKEYAVGMLPEIALAMGALELQEAGSAYEQLVYDYYLSARELALAQQGITLGM